MKQLKFMLAAATALGLATASQAGVEFTDNFDTRKVGGIDTPIALTTPVADLGYAYNGTGENYSEVVAAGDTHNSQMLHVDTDGTPLIRSLGDSAYNLASYESVYIDTMVKFTATPIGDTVTPTPNEDKLMIYLQATNEVTIVNGEEVTNDVNRLMVKAGRIVKVGLNGWDVEPFLCTVDNYTVEPNKWYRLVVTAYKGEKNQAQFKIEMCDPAVSTTLTTLTAVEQHDGVFTSLIKIKTTDATTISSVGFAGEGWIDDLTFGWVSAATSVDFTLALGEGVSAVTYTVGETSGKLPTADGDFTVALNGVSVALSDIQYVLGYKAGSVVAGTYTPEAANATITVDADEKSIVTEGDTPTTGADIGFTGTSFETLKGEKLSKVVAWAGAGRISATTLAGMKFNSTTGDPAGDTEAEKVLEEAYLLNCSPAEVETKKLAFKFTAFDPTVTPVVDGTGYNGDVVIEGATTLSGENGPDWNKDCTNPKFYRARLVFPGTYPPPAAE